MKIIRKDCKTLKRKVNSLELKSRVRQNLEIESSLSMPAQAPTNVDFIFALVSSWLKYGGKIFSLGRSKSGELWGSIQGLSADL